MPTKDVLKGDPSIQQKITDDYIIGQNEKYVETSHKKEPEFIRDVVPTLQPWVMQIIVHVVYFYTGNIMVCLTLMYFGRPIYDKFLLDDSTNLGKKYEKQFTEYTQFKLPMYAYSITLVICWIYYLMLFSDKPHPFQDSWIFKHKPQMNLQIFIFALATGFMAGMGAAAGHELVHYREGIHKFVGSLPFIISFNSHFWDEHVRGHHKYVSTREDPVFPPVGRNIYYSIFHAYVMTHVTTFQREADRIYKSQPTISFARMLLQNALVHCFLFHIFMIWAIYTVFGMASLKFQFLFAFIAQAILEAGNYGEHYGLERRKDENGIYESVQCQHSWNAVSSPFFFRLQRHSDHHLHAYRPYQIVKKLSLAPQLPYCYVKSLLMIFCPPLFFHVMNPRVKAIQDAQKGIPNDDQWNAAQPKSEADKKREVTAQIYFTFVAVLLIAAVFV